MLQPSLLDAPVDRQSAVALCDRLLLLREFQRTPNVWIPLPELARRTGVPQYSITARVRDLRKLKFGGYVIPNRQEHVAGRRHSSYRYTGAA